jgi:D-serine deaminase-like pyridoxal phosphate-dependent protein
MWQAGDLQPVVNEYRAGVYAFNDRNTVSAGAAALDEVALTSRRRSSAGATGVRSSMRAARR